MTSMVNDSNSMVFCCCLALYFIWVVRSLFMVYSKYYTLRGADSSIGPVSALGFSIPPIDPIVILASLSDSTEEVIGQDTLPATTKLIMMCNSIFTI